MRRHAPDSSERVGILPGYTPPQQRKQPPSSPSSQAAAAPPAGSLTFAEMQRFGGLPGYTSPRHRLKAEEQPMEVHSPFAAQKRSQAPQPPFRLSTLRFRGYFEREGPGPGKSGYRDTVDVDVCYFLDNCMIQVVRAKEANESKDKGLSSSHLADQRGALSTSLLVKRAEVLRPDTWLPYQPKDLSIQQIKYLKK